MIKEIIYLPATHEQKAKICRPTKIGGTNRANRMVKIEGKRANLECKFMLIASKSNRADKQRNDRRAKR